MLDPADAERIGLALVKQNQEEHEHNFPPKPSAEPTMVRHWYVKNCGVKRVRKQVISKDWQKDFKDGKQALKDEMGDECEAEVKGEADPWGEYTARTVVLKKNVVQLNKVTTELSALTSKLKVLSKTNH